MKCLFILMFFESFILSACITDGVPTSAWTTPDGVEIERYKYQQQGDTVMLEAKTVVVETCIGDTLVRDSIAQPASSRYLKVKGDSLFGEHTIPQSSGAIIVQTFISNHLAGGPGLKGVWKMVDARYRILSGNLSVEERNILDSTMVNVTGNYEISDITYEFTGSELVVRMDIQTARHFMSLVKANSIAKWIEVTEIDKRKVRMKGLKTGETIELTFNVDGSTVYSSDRPEHVRSTYYNKSRTCPMKYTPDWWTDFIFDNITGTVAIK